MTVTVNAVERLFLRFTVNGGGTSRLTAFTVTVNGEQWGFENLNRELLTVTVDAVERLFLRFTVNGGGTSRLTAFTVTVNGEQWGV